MNKHKVPYMIWANYEIEEETVEPISLNYLSSLLLKTAGLEMTNFQKYLTELQKKLPSVSACGYYDSKGDLYSYTDDVNENYTEWLRQYEMIQYNYLFGGDKRLNHHFELSAASRTARAN